MLRWALYLAADGARQSDPELAALYRRLMVERGRHHHQALCAVASHLAGRIWAVSRTNRPYQWRDLDGTPITQQEARDIATGLRIDAATRQRLRQQRGPDVSRSRQPTAPQDHDRPSPRDLTHAAMELATALDGTHKILTTIGVSLPRSQLNWARGALRRVEGQRERQGRILNAGKKARIAATIPVRDAMNVVRYGVHAPRWAMRIWVPPLACISWAPWLGASVNSGRVVEGSWDLSAQLTADHPDVAPALRHWGQGISWEDVGAYERLAKRIADHGAPQEGCFTHADIVRRFGRLDQMFDQVKREGRLRSASETSLWRRRERNGVLVHIGRDGAPLFGGRGCNRLAAAMTLRLPIVPAQLGVVHPEGVRFLGHYRIQPDSDAGLLKSTKRL